MRRAHARRIPSSLKMFMVKTQRVSHVLGEDGGTEAIFDVLDGVVNKKTRLAAVVDPCMPRQSLAPLPTSPVTSCCDEPQSSKRAAL